MNSYVKYVISYLRMILIIFFVLSFGKNDLFSQITWTGNIDQNWYNVNNWRPNIVPTDIDHVSITGVNVTNYPQLPSGGVTITIRRLTMNNSGLLNNNGSTLSVTFDVTANTGTISGGTLVIGSTNATASVSMTNFSVGTSSNQTQFISYLYKLSPFNNSQVFGIMSMNLGLIANSDWFGLTFWNTAQIYVSSINPAGATWSNGMLTVGTNNTLPVIFKENTLIWRLSTHLKDINLASSSTSPGATEYQTIFEKDLRLVNNRATATLYLTRDAGSLRLDRKVEFETTAGTILTSSGWNSGEADCRIRLGINAYINTTNCSGGNLNLEYFEQETTAAALTHNIETTGANMVIANSTQGGRPARGNLYGTVNLTNTGAGYIRITQNSVNASVTFDGNVNISNSSTGNIVISSAATSYINGILTATNSNTGYIRISESGKLYQNGNFNATNSSTGYIRLCNNASGTLYVSGTTLLTNTSGGNIYLSPNGTAHLVGNTTIQNTGSNLVQVCESGFANITGNLDVHSSSTGSYTRLCYNAVASLSVTGDFTAQNTSSGYLSLCNSGKSTVFGNFIITNTGSNYIQLCENGKCTVGLALTITNSGTNEIRVCNNAGSSISVTGNLNITHNTNSNIQFINSGIGSIGGNSLIVNNGSGFVQNVANSSCTFSGNLTIQATGGGYTTMCDNAGSLANINGFTLLQNSGTNYLRLFNSGVGNFYNDVSITQTGSSYTRVGNKSMGTSACNLSTYKTVQAYNSTLGSVYVESFTQSSPSVQLFQNLQTTGNCFVYYGRNTLKGKVKITGTRVEVSNNIFGENALDSAIIKVTGANASNNGGNVFSGVAEIYCLAKSNSFVWGHSTYGADVFNENANFYSIENITPTPPDPTLGTSLPTTSATYTTTLNTALAPVGNIASAASVSQATAESSNAVVYATTALARAMQTHNAAVATQTFSITCGINTVTTQGRITTANNNLTSANTNYTNALTLVSGVSTNANVNAINTQTNSVNGQTNTLNTASNTDNTTINTCVTNQRTFGLGSGMIIVANNTTNNLFKKRTKFICNSRGRIKLCNGANATALFTSPTDTTFFVNTGNGGSEGAIGINYNNNATNSVIFDGVVYVSSNPSSTTGLYSDPTIYINSYGTTYFKKDWLIDNYGTLNTNIFVGNNGGSITLFTDKRLIVTPNQYKNGEFRLHRLKQLGSNAPIMYNFNNNGTAYWNVRYGWYESEISVTAVDMLIRNNIFYQPIYLRSYSTTGRDNGGNTVHEKAKITYDGTTDWNWGSVSSGGGADIFNSDASFEMNGTGNFSIAHLTGNIFNGNTWFVNNSAGYLYVDQWGTSDATNCVFNGNVYATNYGPGKASGTGNWLQAAIIFAMYNNTGSARLNSYVVNGDFYLKNTNPSAQAKVWGSYRGMAHLNGDVYIENNVSGGTDATEIGFGIDDWSGACQCGGAILYDCKKIVILTFNDGLLTLRRVTQLGTCQTQNLNCTDNYRMNMDSCLWNADITCTLTGMAATRNTFKNRAHLVCYNAGFSSGANVFEKYAKIEFRGTAGNWWRYGNYGWRSDQFLDSIEFNNTGNSAYLSIGQDRKNGLFDNKVIFRNGGTGTNNLLVSHYSSGGVNTRFNNDVTYINENNSGGYIRTSYRGQTIFNKNINLNSSPNSGNMIFSDDTGSSTLNDGAKFVIGNYQGGNLYLTNITQIGTNNPQYISSFNVDPTTTCFWVYMGSNCLWNSTVVVIAPRINLRNSQYNNKSYFESTCQLGLTSNSEGGNTFNDSVSIVHSGTGEFGMGGSGGRKSDYYRGNVKFKIATPNSQIRITNRAPVYFSKGINIETLRDENFVIGDIWGTSSFSAVFDGAFEQNIVTKFSFQQRLVDFSKIDMSRTVGANPVTCDHDMQIRSGYFNVGKITAGNNKVKLTTTGPYWADNPSSYIMVNSTGSAQINIVNNNTFYRYPIGNTNYHLPLQIKQNGGTTDTFFVRCLDGVNTHYTSNVPDGSAITHYFTNGVWLIDEKTAGGTTNASVMTGWSTLSEMPDFDRTSTTVMKYNETTNVWDCTSNPSNSSGTNPYYQTGDKFGAGFLSADFTNTGIFTNVSLYTQNAGPDQIVCFPGTVTMNASPYFLPLTGFWTQVQPSLPIVPRTIDDVLNPNSTIQDLKASTQYAFKWGASTYTGCPQISDEVSVTVLNMGSPSNPNLTNWTGLQDGNWFDCRNWGEGVIPNFSVDVVIPNVNGTTARYPDITIPLHKCKSLDLMANARITLRQSGELEVYKNFMQQGTLSVTNDNPLLIKGDDNSTISGSGINIWRLKMDKTTPDATLLFANNGNINSCLDLYSGKIQTTYSSILTLTENTSVTNVSDNSFVVGPLAKKYTTPGLFLFPVGRNGKYRTIGITGTTTAVNTFMAEYIDNPHSNILSTDLRTDQGNDNLDFVSKVEYWKVQRTAGTGLAILSLYWGSNSDIFATLPTDCERRIRVAQYNSTPKWSNTMSLDTDVFATHANSPNMDLGTLSPVTLAKKKWYNYPVGFDNYWIGCQSPDWHTSANWNMDIVPLTSHKVYIESNIYIYYQPIVYTPNYANCWSIDLNSDSGGSIEVQTGSDLEITQP